MLGIQLPTIKMSDIEKAFKSVPQKSAENLYDFENKFLSALNQQTSDYDAVAFAHRAYNDDDRVRSAIDKIVSKATQQNYNGNCFEVTVTGQKRFAGYAEESINNLIVQLRLNRLSKPILKKTLLSGSKYYQIIFDENLTGIKRLHPLPGLEKGFSMHKVFNENDEHVGYHLIHRSKIKKPIYFEWWQIVPFHWNWDDESDTGLPLHSSAQINFNRLEKMEQGISISRWRSAFRRLVYEFSGASMSDFDDLVARTKAANRIQGRDGALFGDIYTSGKVQSVDQSSQAQSQIQDIEYTENKLRVSGRVPRGIFADGGKGVNRAVLGVQVAEWISSDIKEAEAVLEDGFTVLFTIQMMLDGLHDPTKRQVTFSWPYKHIPNSEILNAATSGRTRGDISGHTFAKLIGSNWDHEQELIEKEIQIEAKLIEKKRELSYPKQPERTPNGKQQGNDGTGNLQAGSTDGESGEEQ